MTSTPEELDPAQFSLFALLRRLEQEHPEKPRIGAARRPSSDVASLYQAPNLTFKGSEVVSVKETAGVSTVRQNSLGMMGPMGALPLHFTEWVYDQERVDEDSALADFVNLVQRRLLALVYRAWSAGDPISDFEHSDGEEFGRFAEALAGFSRADGGPQPRLDPRAVLGNLGLFARGSRPVDALETLIESYFRVRVRVHPFVPQWMELPQALWSRLGARETESLGNGATLGRRVWQSQYSFEIQMGPLSLDEFRSFLPDQDALAILRSLVSSFAGYEWSWHLRLLLRDACASKVQLGRPRQPDSGNRLGWDSWLGAASPETSSVVIRGSSEALA